MVTVALACFILGQDLTFGKFHNRQEFSDAMQRLPHPVRPMARFTDLS